MLSTKLILSLIYHYKKNKHKLMQINTKKDEYAFKEELMLEQVRKREKIKSTRGGR